MHVGVSTTRHECDDDDGNDQKTDRGVGGRHLREDAIMAVEATGTKAESPDYSTPEIRISLMELTEKGDRDRER